MTLGFNLGGLRDRLLGTAAPARIESIAVLPLANLSGDSEQDYFAAGMHEALITDLAKLGGFKRVIARSSVMRYQETDKPLPEIAREFNVDAVITGSVLRSGDLVRITAQLINATTEEHLWAERYERELRDVLSLQNEIVLAIAREIELQLTPQDQTRLASARPVNSEAYEAFVKGQWFGHRRQGNKAIEYFRLAIEKDPTFALPYAYLAQGYAGSVYIPYEEWCPLAEEMLKKALELDETLPEAHAVLGGIRMKFYWDWAGAEREFKRAITLNPNSPEVHMAYKFYLTLTGRFEEALASLKRGRELDPVSYVRDPGPAWTYSKAGLQDEAIAHLQQLLEIDPAHPVAHYHLAYAYAFKKMYKEAIAEAEKGKCWEGCGYIYAVAGERETAREMIQEIERLSAEQYVDPVFTALIYAGLGEKEEALEWLEKGYRVRSGWMIYLKTAHGLDSLRSDPRFQDLLRRMNFPE